MPITSSLLGSTRKSAWRSAAVTAKSAVPARCPATGVRLPPTSAGRWTSPHPMQQAARGPRRGGHLGQRPQVPHRQPRGRLHPRMPGDPRRFLATGAPRHFDARRRRPRARLSRYHRGRQRPRIHWPRPRELGSPERRQAVLHRPIEGQEAFDPIPGRDRASRPWRGKPMQNGSIESFNGRFRDECLDPHWFRSLDEARRIIERWRVAYNETRPHTALRMSTPKAFAAARPFERPRQAAPAPELSDGSTPEPLAALSTPVLSQTDRFHL